MIRPPYHLLSVLFFLTTLSTPFFYLSAEPTKASNVEESSSQNLYRSLIKLSLTQERGKLLLKTIEQITSIEKVIVNLMDSEETQSGTELVNKIKSQISSIDAFVNLWQNEKYAVFRTSEKESADIQKALLDYKTVITAYLERDNSALPTKERVESKIALIETFAPLIKHLRTCNSFSANWMRFLQQSLKFENQESEKAAFLLRKTISIQSLINQKLDNPNFHPIRMEIKFFQNLLETDQFEKKVISSLEEYMSSAENNPTDIEPLKSKTRERFVKQIEKLKVRFKSQIEAVRRGSVQTVIKAIDNAEEEERLTFVAQEGDQLLHIGHEAIPYSGFLKTNYEHGQEKKLLSIHEGRVHGATLMWHEGGQIKGRVHWKNGKPNGTMVTWDSHGKLIQEGYWVDGKLKWTANDWDGSAQPINRKVIHNSPILDQTTKQKLNERSKSGEPLQEWIKYHQSKQTAKHYDILKNYGLKPVDLDDVVRRTKILKVAVDLENLQIKKENGLEIFYQSDVPFSGWVKRSTPQISAVIQIKEGKANGALEVLYSNGRKCMSQIFKDGKILSAVSWKPNGEMCLITGIKEGTGVTVLYDGEGNEFRRMYYESGKEIRFNGKSEKSDSGVE
jgi:antitoxin component YwqK of YwqJK toxin-antitoxin module